MSAESPDSDVALTKEWLARERRTSEGGGCGCKWGTIALAVSLVLAMVVIAYITMNRSYQPMQRFALRPTGIYNQELLPYRISYDPASYSELNDL